MIELQRYALGKINKGGPSRCGEAGGIKGVGHKNGSLAKGAIPRQ